MKTAIVLALLALVVLAACSPGMYDAPDAGGDADGSNVGGSSGSGQQTPSDSPNLVAEDEVELGELV